VAEYREALPSSVPPRVLVAVPVHAGAGADRAERALQRFLDSRAAPGGPEYASHLARHPQLRRASGLIEEGLAIVGNERTVRERVDQLRACGATHLAGIFDFGALPTEASIASMRGFSEWVGLRSLSRPEPAPAHAAEERARALAA
jgi:hypothetical protein